MRESAATEAGGRVRRRQGGAVCARRPGAQEEGQGAQPGGLFPHLGGLCPESAVSFQGKGPPHIPPREPLIPL